MTISIETASRICVHVAGARHSTAARARGRARRTSARGGRRGERQAGGIARKEPGSPVSTASGAGREGPRRCMQGKYGRQADAGAREVQEGETARAQKPWFTLGRSPRHHRMPPRRSLSDARAAATAREGAHAPGDAERPAPRPGRGRLLIDLFNFYLIVLLGIAAELLVAELSA